MATALASASWLRPRARWTRASNQPTSVTMAGRPQRSAAARATSIASSAAYHVEPVHGGQADHEVAAGADVGGQAVLPVEGDHLVGHRLALGVLLEAERGPAPHEGGPDQRRVVVAPGGGDRRSPRIALTRASPAWSRLVASIPSSRTRSGDRSS